MSMSMSMSFIVFMSSYQNEPNIWCVVLVYVPTSSLTVRFSFSFLILGVFLHSFSANFWNMFHIWYFQLQQLVNTGTLTSCSDELADLAEDLGCTIERAGTLTMKENGTRVTVPANPEIKARLTSAVVVAYCFESTMGRSADMGMSRLATWGIEEMLLLSCELNFGYFVKIFGNHKYGNMMEVFTID